MTRTALASDGAASNRASFGPRLAAAPLVANQGGVGQTRNGARATVFSGCENM